MLAFKFALSATLALVASASTSAISVVAAADNATAPIIPTLSPHASINCVCWGLCCSYCRGEGCPQRRRLEDDGNDGDSPFVWANVGVNGTALLCRQRSYGLECPLEGAH